MESQINQHEVGCSESYPTKSFTTLDTKNNGSFLTSNMERECSIVPTQNVPTEKRSSGKSCTFGGCMSSMSSFIILGLEKTFFRIGFFVGTYPILTIVVCLIMCALTGLGMKTFTGSTEDDTVWVPKGSRLLNERKWVEDTFPAATRYVTLMIENKVNVLSPPVITSMLEYYEKSRSVDANRKRFSDICVKIGPACSVTSILELWNYNATLIRSLTADDIIDTINSTKITPQSRLEVRTLLGGKFTEDEYGTILTAQATQMTWTSTKKDEDSAAAFEKAMIDIALKGSPNIDRTYCYATRSFDDEGYSAINSDVNLLATGFIIVFVYILFALGKFNLLEQKIYLSLTGMVCVGLSVLVAYGIGTALSIVYSPIQSIMPFLLLGIGVDDMFVIVESWKNLRAEDERLDVPNKIALCLSRAGVSITVTSVTDVVAFGIGASTVIPALASFCIYATIGIFALFFLVSTLFIAILALDERRRKDRRDSCFFCYRHSDDYQPCRYSTGRSFLQIFFKKYYGPLITKKPVKVTIILLSLVMTSLALWRFVQMEEDFDVVNYIPSDSYAYQFSRTREFYFNRQGISTRIYCGDFDYYKYQHQLERMYSEMASSPFIQKGTINAWFNAYHNHLNDSGIIVTSEQAYYHELKRFLRSRGGRHYSPFVKWNATRGPISISASYIKATHVREDNSHGNINSMDNLRTIIDSSGFPKFSGDDMPEYMCLSYVREYQSLETNKVLQTELYRNLGLAAAAVLIVTIILVANIKTSIMVFICVFCTVVDVGGVLEVWGTTIDTASSVLLTLSVGLAVDYSVHIGHTFMTVEGSRQGRSVLTLEHIGPAVFNGGLSTFLAFVLLANSASYGFQLFFRVFMSVVIFGMFHGLCLLPVLLSLTGPPSYKELQENVEKESHTNGHVHTQTDIPGKRPDSPVEMCQVGYEGPFSKLYDLNDKEKIPSQDRESNGYLHKVSPGRDSPGPSEDNESSSTHSQKHISVIKVGNPPSVAETIGNGDSGKLSPGVNDNHNQLPASDPNAITKL